MGQTTSEQIDEIVAAYDCIEKAEEEILGLAKEWLDENEVDYTGWSNCEIITDHLLHCPAYDDGSLDEKREAEARASRSHKDKVLVNVIQTIVESPIENHQKIRDIFAAMQEAGKIKIV